MKTIRDLAERFKIKPAMMQQCAAVGRLRPDLDKQLLAGTMTIEQAMPLVEAEFYSLLLKQMEKESRVDGPRA